VKHSRGNLIFQLTENKLLLNIVQSPFITFDM